MPGQLPLFAPSEEPSCWAGGLCLRARVDCLAAKDSSSRKAIAELCRVSTEPSFVIANNKAEGSAPLSVFKLAEEISSSYHAMP